VYTFVEKNLSYPQMSWLRINSKYNSSVGLCCSQDVGEKIYTVPDIVKEIRDATTRARLQVLPYELQFKQPPPEAIRYGRWSYSTRYLVLLASNFTINGCTFLFYFYLHFRHIHLKCLTHSVNCHTDVLYIKQLNDLDSRTEGLPLQILIQIDFDYFI